MCRRLDYGLEPNVLVSGKDGFIIFLWNYKRTIQQAYVSLVDEKQQHGALVMERLLATISTGINISYYNTLRK